MLQNSSTVVVIVRKCYHLNDSINWKIWQCLPLLFLSVTFPFAGLPAREKALWLQPVQEHQADRGEDSFDKASAAAGPWWPAKAWDGAGLVGKTREFWVLGKSEVYCLTDSYWPLIFQRVRRRRENEGEEESLWQPILIIWGDRNCVYPSVGKQEVHHLACVHMQDREVSPGFPKLSTRQFLTCCWIKLCPNFLNSCMLGSNRNFCQAISLF